MALDTKENMNKLFKCKLRTEEKMDIEHVTEKEACITNEWRWEAWVAKSQ